MGRQQWGLLACTVLAMTSCDGDELVDGATGSLNAAPEFRLIQSYQLGGVEASEYEAFSREPRVAARSDGHLFVLDQGTDEVTEYAADGTLVRAFGGQGEGPSEFSFAGDLGLVGDSVWVRNLTPPFASVFAPDGTYVRRQAVDELVVGRTGMPDGPDAILVGGYHLSVAQAPLGSEPGGQDVPVRLIAASGEVDTLDIVVDPPTAYAPGVGSLGAWYPGTIPPRWAVTPGGESVVVIDWDPSGLVYVREAVLGGGETLDSVQLPMVSLSSEAADSIVNAAADSARARIQRAQEQLPPEVAPTVPSDLEERIRSALNLGPALPPVRDFVVGTDGSLWIERPVAPNRWEWAIFDRELRPIGRITLPDGHTLRAATPDAIWTTRTDALDVPYVTKFELNRDQ